MQYRPEIDGLRAIAVIPVILFHAGFELFSGGFVGVDVFFVISGYLITSIIIKEKEEGTFRLVNFYERRIRRILPALYLVSIFCIPFAWIFMLPDPLENFGQSLVATTLFSNNILLTLTAGYWDLAVEFKPLIHTWTLAVEEQYYVIFPLFLLITWSFGKRWIIIIISIIALMSLSAAQWGIRNHPEATFYLLPTRIWELLIGSLISFYLFKKKEPKGNQLLSIVGLLMVSYSIIKFDESTPFPSIYTLLPTVGTALIIIFTSPQTVLHRLLSKKFLVGVGLISYSAYLWHKPLFAFSRIYSIEEFDLALYSFLILLTFLLAFFTWKFVEVPFRKKEKIKALTVYKIKALTVYSLAMSVGVILVVSGYFFHITHGIPKRIFSDNSVESSDMYISYNMKIFSFKKDAFDETKKINILVLGNSSSRDFVNMMIENLPTDKLSIVYRNDYYDCLKLNMDDLLKKLISDSDVVVFGGATTNFDCIAKDINLLEGANKEVFYVGPKHFGYNLNWLTRIQPQNRILATNNLSDKIILLEEKFSSVVPEKNYLSILNPILLKSKIPITDPHGRLISPDRNHITKQGAQYLGKKVLDHKIFLEALQMPKNIFK